MEQRNAKEFYSWLILKTLQQNILLIENELFSNDGFTGAIYQYLFLLLSITTIITNKQFNPQECNCDVHKFLPVI